MTDYVFKISHTLVQIAVDMDWEKQKKVITR